MHQVAKVLEFQLNISPSNKYSGLISFRIDWFDPLAVQRTLKNLLQHYSSKASILWSSALLYSNSHIHWINEAIQPSHPLLPPSPPTLNLSQHQGLFQWVSSLHEIAKVLELQLQYQSFQWIFRLDFLKDWLILSCWLLLSRVFSSTTIQSYQFFSCWSSLWSNFHICTWLLEKNIV